MRRVAMLLGAVGVAALGLAGSPAQAQQWGWGYPQSRHEASGHDASRYGASRDHQSREWAWRRHEWREHHSGHQFWRPWYSRYGG